MKGNTGPNGDKVNVVVLCVCALLFSRGIKEIKEV